MHCKMFSLYLLEALVFPQLWPSKCLQMLPMSPGGKLVPSPKGTTVLRDDQHLPPCWSDSDRVVQVGKRSWVDEPEAGLLAS